jgi:hypothetical protein
MLSFVNAIVSLLYCNYLIHDLHHIWLDYCDYLIMQSYLWQMVHGQSPCGNAPPPPPCPPMSLEQLLVYRMSSWLSSYRMRCVMGHNVYSTPDTMTWTVPTQSSWWLTHHTSSGERCDSTTSEMRGLSPKIISGDSRRSENTQTHTHKHTVPNMKFKLKLLQIKCHVLGFIKDKAQIVLQRIIRVFAEAFVSHDRHTLFALEESGPPRTTYTCGSQ